MLPLMRDPQTKPEWGAELDPSHPLVAQGVSMLMPLNEGMGTIVKDVSGNSLTGTLNGGVTWAPSSKGIVPTFDGSTGVIASTPFTIPIFPLTLAAWIIPAVTTLGSILYYGSSLNECGILQNSGQFWALTQSGAANVQAIGGTVTVGKPTFVCGVFPSASLRLLYVDGQWVASDTNTQSPSPVSPAAQIGKRWGVGSSQFLKFSALNSFIFPYALTAQQIADLNANPWGMFAPRTLRMAGRASGGLLLRRRRAAA